MNHPALLSSIIMLVATSTTSAIAAPAKDGRIYFDNQSSSAISIYRAPLSPRSQPVKQLAPGEVFGTVSTPAVQWVAATPVWYRLVGSAKSGRNNRAVIRDADVKAIGTERLNTKFANGTKSAVDVKIVVSGKELDWLKIASGETVRTLSFADQNWAIRDSKTGKLIQKATTPSTASTINIDASEVAPKPKPVAKRKPAARKKPVAKPEPVANSAKPKHRRKPAPTANPSAVTHEFHNDTKSTVFIYQEKDEQLVFASRLNPGKTAKIPSEPGDAISIRDPKTKEELMRMKSPPAASALHIEPVAVKKTAPKAKPAQKKPVAPTSSTQPGLLKKLFGE